MRFLLPVLFVAMFLGIQAPVFAHFDDFHPISVADGVCLDVHAPDVRRDGALVQLWTCNGEPQQLWRYDGAGRLINKAGGLCLSLDTNSSGENGAKVEMRSCDATSWQQWRWESRLEYSDRYKRTPIVWSVGGEDEWCLDAHAPTRNQNGGRVQLWQCNAQPAQDWSFETCDPDDLFCGNLFGWNENRPNFGRVVVKYDREVRFDDRGSIDISPGRHMALHPVTEAVLSGTAVSSRTMQRRHAKRCEQKCRETEACYGYTVLAPGVQSPDANCYLKDFASLYPNATPMPNGQPADLSRVTGLVRNEACPINADTRCTSGTRTGYRAKIVGDLASLTGSASAPMSGGYGEARIRAFRNLREKAAELVRSDFEAKYPTIAPRCQVYTNKACCGRADFDTEREGVRYKATTDLLRQNQMIFNIACFGNQEELPARY